jgi:UDPglucose 6-dehydrogenase
MHGEAMRVAVYGLWHLGCVTAACLAEAGHDVVGLDPDDTLIDGLRQGVPPLHEPGLAELLVQGLHQGRLSFTSDHAALRDTDVLWVTFDTPVNDQDEADVAFVRSQLDVVRHALRPGTMVLISSQVPVGFSRALESDWAGHYLHFAYSPENLRLGKALDVFRNPERVVVGVRRAEDKELLAGLFPATCPRFEWMSVESAEMTKHALNAFLATSVTFINELAVLCESVGADAKEVERGLKSEARIGPKAYLSPGAAFAGGTLARDVQFLIDCGRRHGSANPLLIGVLASNVQHKAWAWRQVQRLTGGCDAPVVAVLGLTYKPGTSTLRRSGSLELCEKLHAAGYRVRVHDPVVSDLPGEYRHLATHCVSAGEALTGADAAVVATPWPEYRELTVTSVLGRMRRPQIIDPNHFLPTEFTTDERVTYVAPGKAGVLSPPLAISA